MSTPSEPPAGDAQDRPAQRAEGTPNPAGNDLDPNDPYRFGLPDTPPPPEFAPPGWTPPGGWPAPSPSAPSPLGPPGGPPGGSSAPSPWSPPGLPPGQPGAPSGGYGAPSGLPGAPPPYAGGPYPNQPYPPYPYPPQGYQPSPYTPAHGQASRARGKSITAFVLGGLSILLCWLMFFDAILVIAAVAFGVIGLSDSRAAERAGAGRSASGRGFAIAGLVAAAIGAVLAIGFSVLVIHAMNACGGFGSAQDPGFRSCVQHQL